MSLNDLDWDIIDRGLDQTNMEIWFFSIIIFIIGICRLINNRERGR